ncbi:aminotransferase IV [Fervidobacterium changbaicum]|uniref:Aminotransferase IV n=1 Tax=Fervidobacterium changbaicum TaxID=310769 RepID=A0ABX5QQP7_9BACT|nr:aminotransferase IV [Fervidobacterium changbaicum]
MKVWCRKLFKSRHQTNEIIDALTKGIAVYETLRTYNGKPFAIEEHYRRLCKSLGYLKINPPTYEEFEKLIYDNLSERIRVVYVYDGRLLSYVFQESTENFTVDYVKIDFTNVRRAGPSSIPPDLKSLGRPDIYLARLTKGDNYDVLLLGSKGQLCEGTFSNVFLLKGGRFVTPSLDSGILDGITRMYVIRFLKEKGYTVEERFVEPCEVFYADEVFLTHTSRGIVPVHQVGTLKTISTSLSEKLAKEFEEYIKCLL